MPKTNTPENIAVVAKFLRGEEYCNRQRFVENGELYLYATKIAWFEEGGSTLCLTFGKHPTPTTFRLLNEILLAINCPHRFGMQKKQAVFGVALVEKDEVIHIPIDPATKQEVSA